ncbi:MAG: anion permease [Deltaproteobacteria bacterium]|nr:anion permease [Deltaproteobacteria bacterium]MBW2151231.1 anion permease [Deltaproteobacteria bacterium]
MDPVESKMSEKPETKVLLVDDEDQFRKSLAQQLSVRGFKVEGLNNGKDAIKFVRHENPEVVVLDQKMPGMDGIQTLKEIKKIRPEIQVIMLTGHGNTETARVTGKYDVFYYLEKPCSIDELIGVIDAAKKERVYALARHEIPDVKRRDLKLWLVGAHNFRPGLIALGIILFTAIAAMPTPKGLLALVSQEKSGTLGEKISGYSNYRKVAPGQNISDYYTFKTGLHQKVKKPDGTVSKVPLRPEQVAFRAKVMIGVLLIAALFWATGAVPIGITALLVGVIMYFFGILPPNLVAKAYAKDSVIFIFGVLAMAVAIGNTGLDRRIGLVLLGTSTSLSRFAFIFGPLLAITASFLSEHALVAFLAPILILVYGAAIRRANITKDKSLAVMMLLILSYCGNAGGPGSPAAGGRNAVMLGILSDYGMSVSFSQWLKMGLPFVPVMALVTAAYFFLAFKRKIKVKNLDIAEEVKREAEKIGKMTFDEYKAAAVLVLLVVLWATASDRFGMGGPVLLCIVLSNILGIIRWRDINSINWDVVALYGAASAMGYGLAITGAALWLADSFVGLLPDSLTRGTGLLISCSFITGILTNFMSDGATVAAVGPITVPMATLSGTSPIMVGLATSFASSFAHVLIIGTPNNAIAYSMGKDPETGEQLLTMKDFFVHGSVVFVLSLGVLWVWVFWGYWKCISI